MQFALRLIVLVLIAGIIGYFVLDLSPTTTEGQAHFRTCVSSIRVNCVVDGDTIHVLIDGVEYRLRYIGIDTPETNHPTLGVQPFGPEASQANSELVEGKTVWLEKDVSETDRYGRLLRYVYVDDLMVNEELLRRGLARVATFPPDVKYVDRFLDIQRAAQEGGLGLWGPESSQAEPTPTTAPTSAPASEAWSANSLSRAEPGGRWGLDDAAALVWTRSLVRSSPTPFPTRRALRIP